MLSEKSSSQVNLVIPPVVNRLISVGELRAVAIKHLVELLVAHEFFGHFFSKRKTCHVYVMRNLFLIFTLRKHAYSNI